MITSTKVATTGELPVIRGVKSKEPLTRETLAKRIAKVADMFSSIAEDIEQNPFITCHSCFKEYFFEKLEKTGLGLTDLTDDDVAFFLKFGGEECTTFEFTRLINLCEVYFRELSRIHVGSYWVGNARVWEPVPHVINYFMGLQNRNEFGPSEKYFEQLHHITNLARKIDFRSK